jgi:hypothetical protein
MPIFRCPSRPRRSVGPLASTLALTVLFATLAPTAARADVPITPEARAHFGAGVNLLKDPDGPRYEEAYREFRVAYAASPSFKILGNLGLCAMKLERDEEAIAAYEKYLAEGKGQLDPATMQQVQTDLQTLKAGVAWITVSSTPPGAQIIDVRLPVRGDRITNAYGPVSAPLKIGIHQGTHEITARLAGYPDAVWEFDTTGARALAPHVFEFKAPVQAGPAPMQPAPAPTPADEPHARPVMTLERPVPTSVWIGAAVTGALAVGTVVTGLVATSKHSDFEAANDGRDPDAASSLKDSGQTMNLVADVMLGGTLVAAGVTTFFFVTRPSVEVEAASPASPAARRAPAPRALRLAPMVGTRGGGVALTGGLPWM